MAWYYFDAKTMLGSARLFSMILDLMEIYVLLVDSMKLQKARGEDNWCLLSSYLVSDTVLDPLPCRTTLEPQENLLDSLCGRCFPISRGSSKALRRKWPHPLSMMTACSLTPPPHPAAKHTLPSWPSFMDNFSWWLCHFLSWRVRGGHIL